MSNIYSKKSNICLVAPKSIWDNLGINWDNFGIKTVQYDVSKRNIMLQRNSRKHLINKHFRLNHKQLPFVESKGIEHS